MHANVLLQQDRVGELLLADRAGVLHLHQRTGAGHPQVRLQVAFGGEGAAADLAGEGPLPGVRAAVHLERALAAEDAVADETLVGVVGGLVYVLHQPLQLQGLRSRLRRPTPWEASDPGGGMGRPQPGQDGAVLTFRRRPGLQVAGQRPPRDVLGVRPRGEILS